MACFYDDIASSRIQDLLLNVIPRHYLPLPRLASCTPCRHIHSLSTSTFAILKTLLTSRSVNSTLLSGCRHCSLLSSWRTPLKRLIACHPTTCSSSSSATLRVRLERSLVVHATHGLNPTTFLMQQRVCAERGAHGT